MFQRKPKPRSSRQTKIHSSGVPSSEFQNILERFCIQFGLYPSFTIIKDPRRRFLREWGEIRLPQIPEGKLQPATKYWLFNGLSYHAIAPSTEYNRLMLRYVISNQFRRFTTDSPAVSSMSGVFCTLLSFTKLSRNEYWKDHVKEVLDWNVRKLEGKEKSLIRDFTRSYYQLLLGRSVPQEWSHRVERVYHSLKNPIEMRRKAEIFVQTLKDVFESEAIPTRSFEQKVNDFSGSIGSPFQNEELWEDNWRSEEESAEISPEDVAKLSQIDHEEALQLAKKLDERERKTRVKQKKEKDKRGMTSGWLPRYSKRQKMLQQLLETRRYIAAVRRVRLKLLLEELGAFKGRRKREVGGKTDWHMGDNAEELDVEASMENFGHLIPGLTTLRDFWVKSSTGSRRGGARHVELLIDTSKSMEGRTIERGIDVGLAITEKAKERQDFVGLTTFSSGAWEGFPPCRSYNAIEELLLRLMARGGTNIRHALQLVEDHLSQSKWNSTLCIITDTAIWDVSYPSVQRTVKSWANTLPVLIIALTKQIYPQTRDTFGNSEVEIVHVSDLERKSWQVVLSKF